MSRVKVLNAMIDNLTMEETIMVITELIRENKEQGKSSYVVTPNLDHLVNLDRDEEFRAAYEDADLILADGMSIIAFAKLLKRPLKEKVSGSDLFPRLSTTAAEEGFTMFILGAAPGVADLCADNLVKKNPGLQIVGTYSPAWGFENDPKEIHKMIELVRAAAPDILAIALGDKKGEKFLYRHSKEMGVPIALSIGASVDFEAHTKKRAPKWMSCNGLEWLYRVIQEPSRFGRRAVKDIIHIIPLIVKYR